MTERILEFDEMLRRGFTKQQIEEQAALFSANHVAIANAARFLLMYLGENAGMSADWPIHMICEDLTTADVLTKHLQDLQDALKLEGYKTCRADYKHEL